MRNIITAALVVVIFLLWFPFESGLLFLLQRNDHMWVNIDARNYDAPDPPINDFRALMAIPCEQIPRSDDFPFSWLPLGNGVPLRLAVEIDNLKKNRVAICSAEVYSKCQANDTKCLLDIPGEFYASTKSYPCKVPKDRGRILHESKLTKQQRVELDVRAYSSNFSRVHREEKKAVSLSPVWVVWVENHNLLQSADIEYSLSTRIYLFGNIVFSTWWKRIDLFGNSVFSTWWNSVQQQLNQITAAPVAIHRWMKSSSMCQAQKVYWYRGGVSKRQRQITSAIRAMFGPYVGSLDTELAKVTSLWYQGHTVVFTIVVVNIIMFVVQLTQPNLGVEYFAISRLTYSKWRLFTSTFTHGNMLHIALNMAALVHFGPRVHLLLDCDNYAFIFVYVLATFFAGWSVYYLTSAHTRTWGASGAIYGIMAAKFVLTGSNPSVGFSEFFAWIIVDTLQTVFKRPGVSWQGHFGGAFGGATAAYLWLKL